MVFMVNHSFFKAITPPNMMAERKTEKTRDNFFDNAFPYYYGCTCTTCKKACCSMLQSVAVCCSVLQYVAGCCSVCQLCNCCVIFVVGTGRVETSGVCSCFFFLLLSVFSFSYLLCDIFLSVKVALKEAVFFF